MRIGLNKRGLLRDHFVQRQTKSVDIAQLGRFATEPFWCHVTQTAAERSGCRRIVIKISCQPKVGDLGGAVFVDQDVGWFNVTMKHAVFVGIVNRTGNLFSQRGNVRVGKLIVVFHQRIQ